MNLTEPMWKALAFLAVHDRWRTEVDRETIGITSIRGLVRRQFADAYDNETEAWITTGGQRYLAQFVSDIFIEYALPAESSHDLLWVRGRGLSRLAISQPFTIRAARQEVQHEMQESNPGSSVLTRVHFSGHGLPAPLLVGSIGISL
jgi:hypothetical protein